MKTFVRILSFARPYWVSGLLHILFTIISVMALGFSLALLDPVLNLIFTENVGSAQIPQQEFSLNLNEYFNAFLIEIINNEGKARALAYAVLIIVCINILGNFARYWSSRFMGHIRTKVVEDIRRKLFFNITTLRVGFFEGERKGDLINKMTSDVNAVEMHVITTFKALIRDPFTIIFFLYMMFSFSWKLTLFIFGILPLTAFLIGRIGKSLRKSTNRVQESLSMMMSILDEFLSGIRVVKAFKAEHYIRGIFSKYNKNYSHQSRRQIYRETMVPPISETLGVITVGLILWFGGRLVFEGEINASGFIVFIFFFQQLLTPAKSLSSSYSTIQKGIASGDRLFNLMDARLVVEEKTGATELQKFEKEIKIENLSFSYSSEVVLKDINVTIEKGKIFALVGPSGSGKTTLVELILRFYDPSEGNIAIDGRDIREYTLESLRGQIGLVSQDPILFNDTVFNNIAFGLKNVRKEDVEYAAKAAHAHEFIVEMPEGYGTVIGDRGALLSGGQRQRISIARALLANPPLLILDEATSALDTSSERIVQQALYKLMQNRTSIVIAHRLSTIQQADQILVLDKGRLVQQGTHQELANKEGLYRKLYEMQQLDS